MSRGTALKGIFVAAMGVFSLLLLPSVTWAGGGGATGLINPATFALVVELGTFLTIIFLAWVIKEKLGIPLPKLLQAPIIWLTAYIVMRYFLQPPIPFSLLAMYMGIITLAIFLYVSIDEPSWEAFTTPISTMLMADRGRAKMSRYFVFTALPLFLGYSTYDKLLPKFEEPIELRTVHPAPPASVNVHNKIITLQTAENPYRVGDDGKYLKVGDEGKYHGQNPFAEDAPKFLQNVRDGGMVFFGTAGCFLCHGDHLDGKGPFSYAFNPIPANFADPGTIAQLQETFVFWRVTKGGPGVPRETFPWASAMPPWEKHLTTEEIWKVILFEYWRTGFFPRSWD
jgi:hypothetical protein